MGMICHNKRYTCFFLSSLSNKPSKIFPETFLNWTSTTFCEYPLLQNQAFKCSRCFGKVNGDEQSLSIRNPFLQTIDFVLWNGWGELKWKGWWRSVGLQNKAVSILLLTILTLLSKKLTESLDFSYVNFKLGCKLLRQFRNSSSLLHLLFRWKMYNLYILTITMA